MMDHQEAESKGNPPTALAVALRYAFAGVSILALLWLQMLAVRDGYSRYYSDNFRNLKDLSAAESAVKYNSNDPQAYYARAHALRALGKVKEAVVDYERAALHAPFNYFLWLELGYSRLLDSNREDALSAFKRSADIAPYYSQPRRYLGITLLTSQREEAFREFRLAIRSDPSLLNEVLNSAWETFQGDALSVIDAIAPQSESARIETARFLIQHGAAEAAVGLIRAARDTSDEGKKSILDLLIRARKYRDARLLWEELETVRESLGKEVGSGKIIDGGFEKTGQLEEPFFGWQFTKNIPGLRISRDKTDSHSGQFSLRLDFSGSESTSTMVSQLIQLEPQGTYDLDFVYRTSQMVTGGQPVVRILDAYSGKMIEAASIELAQTENWKPATIRFQAGDSDFLLLSLERRGCGGSCPIFGRLWLDGFSLKPVNVNREL